MDKVLFVYSERGDYECVPKFYLIPSDSNELDSIKSLDGKVINSSGEDGSLTKEQSNQFDTLMESLYDEGSLKDYKLESIKDLAGKTIPEIYTLDFLL